jgi:hypothetical protein
MWCKTRAADRTLVLPPRARAHAWGKYRVFLYSIRNTSMMGKRTLKQMEETDLAFANIKESRHYGFKEACLVDGPTTRNL